MEKEKNTSEEKRQLMIFAFGFLLGLITSSAIWFLLVSLSE